MAEITIEEIRRRAADENNIIAKIHARKRMSERRIEFDDVAYVLRNGEIIEQYPRDYPFPSCLVLGFVVNDTPLHVCCSIEGNTIWVITVYYPDEKNWESDWKTRRKGVDTI